jgi:hypothetical protein
LFIGRLDGGLASTTPDAGVPVRPNTPTRKPMSVIPDVTETAPPRPPVRTTGRPSAFAALLVRLHFYAGFWSPRSGYASLPADSAVLSGPIDDGMTEAVRILLEAGADPNRLLPGSTFRDVDPDEDFDEDEFFAAMEREYPPIHPLSAAVKSDAPAELITLLLEHGAFDSAALALARRRYRRDVVELLERFGHQ